MDYGFIKAAVCSPEVSVADPDANASLISVYIDRCRRDGVRIAVFPELSITGSTCADLFYQDALLNSAEEALTKITAATSGQDILVMVGLPVRAQGKLYNCAAVIANGSILGIVPKTALESAGGLSDARYFSSGRETSAEIDLLGESVPFGTDILFRCDEMPALTIGVEIGSDVFSVNPPSVRLAQSGAKIIANLAASSETVGTAAFRRAQLQAHSVRIQAGYLYAGAGRGESTTDSVFAGHGLIVEKGELLAESRPFGAGYAVSEIDLETIANDRLRLAAFDVLPDMFSRVIPFSLEKRRTKLTRRVNPLPFVPVGAEFAERCETILSIQSAGLAKRLTHTGARSLVLGISGGLDSTLALLVSVRALEMTGRPLSGLVAVTMPGYGTTPRTKSNAIQMCEALGATVREISIVPAVDQHFKDLGHDPSDHSILYENAQARERTQILMDICHQTDGLVVGTGDLSELALGWATYNGDHMSMYGVNGGVPKTLVRHLIRYAAETSDNEALKTVLSDVLDTPVSPELLPASGEKMTQLTESILGPYDLHDFFLYMIVRRGFTPRKTLYLAEYAFSGKADRAEILKTLTLFLRRFFSNQFKRSCLPDGPKVVSVSLSPRGAWRMPSDAAVRVWLDNLAEDGDLE